MKPPFHAVILAAGEGTRYSASGGTTLKQVAPYQGVPVIRRLADQVAASQAFCGLTIVLGPDPSHARTIKAALSGCPATYVVNPEARRDNNLLSFLAGTRGLATGALLIEADCVVAQDDLVAMVENTGPGQICWANIGPAARYDYGGVIRLDDTGRVRGVSVLDAQAYAAFKAESRAGNGVKMFGLTAFGAQALQHYHRVAARLQDPYHKYFHAVASTWPEEFDFCTVAMSPEVFSFNVTRELKTSQNHDIHDTP